jgi:RNA polymerase sigma factor (TIGR02999 family)
VSPGGNRDPMSTTSGQVERLLEELSGGQKAAAEELFPLVYDNLRALARSYLGKEGPAHTLQPTELVHEAFLRMVHSESISWQGRAHFFAIGAQVMRRILVDHAKRKRRQKRGGEQQRISLNEHVAITPHRSEDVLAIEDALEKLSELDKRQAEIVELRFYGGLTVEEVAEVLQVSRRTVEAEWTAVRAWLRRELSVE